VLLKLGEWVGVRESKWVKNAAATGGSGTVVELQQVVFMLDGVKMKGTEVGCYLSLCYFRSLNLFFRV